jgi:hypothetical protein
MIRSLGFVVIGAAIVALLFAAGSAAQTEVTNPSFETGDTTGWVETIPAGGTIEIVNNCDAPCSGFDSFDPYEPVDGDFFALLKTDGPGSFTTLSQTLVAQAGVEISGWAFFYNAETICAIEPFLCASVCDETQINIYVDDVLTEEVFAASSCTTSSTDWTQWTFTVPGASCEEVEITIEARITNIGDSVVDSLMGVDALELDESACPTPVPTEEPTATPEPESEGRIRRAPTGGPGLGAGLAALLAASNSNQSSDTAAEEDVAGVQAVDGAIGPISPPNTGDAGLAQTSRTNATVYGAVIVSAALGLGPLLLARVRRTR